MIGVIVELLAALDEVEKSVPEEGIWLHFMNKLPPVISLLRTTCNVRRATYRHSAGRCTVEQVQRTIGRKEGEHDFGFCIVRVRLEV